MENEKWRARAKSKVKEEEKRDAETQRRRDGETEREKRMVTFWTSGTGPFPQEMWIYSTFGSCGGLVRVSDAWRVCLFVLFVLLVLFVLFVLSGGLGDFVVVALFFGVLVRLCVVLCVFVQVRSAKTHVSAFLSVPWC